MHFTPQENCSRAFCDHEVSAQTWQVVKVISRVKEKLDLPQFNINVNKVKDCPLIGLDQLLMDLVPGRLNSSRVWAQIRPLFLTGFDRTHFSVQV